MNNDNAQRLIMYKTLLEQAVGKRKENISAKDLAEKLKIEPTSIYRLERGVNDMKLSTFIAYLDAFNYEIEIIPRSDLSAKETKVDFVSDDGTTIEFSQTDPSTLLRKEDSFMKPLVKLVISLGIKIAFIYLIIEIVKGLTY